jgi:hypothetical protein
MRNTASGAASHPVNMRPERFHNALLETLRPAALAFVWPNHIARVFVLTLPGGIRYRNFEIL